VIARQFAALSESDIEALCAAQGLDLLGAAAGGGVEDARRVVREHVPQLERDRVLAPDIATISDLLEREVLVAGVRVRLPDLA